MKSYVARRLARAVLLLFAVSVLCFLLTRLAPGTYFDEIRLNPQISPQTIALLQARYGLNQPLGVRYAHWMRSVLRGDFGFSVAYNTPVASLMWAPAEHTLLLGGVAMLLCWLIAVPVAVWSARYQGSWLDRALSLLTSFFLSVPEIVLAVGLLALVVRSHALPVGGLTSVGFDDLSAWGKAADVTRHLLAPVAILVLVGTPVIVRHLRSSVLEVLHAPFVEAARCCGIGGARLLFRHVLPAAANPAISLFGLSLAALLSGSLLVEVVTGWPGLGPLILDATLARDLDVVVAAAMLAAVMMIVGNFAADLLLLAADPRIRTGSPDAV
ncbi:MAG TPA: ABC transporter permease [Terriglobales bacterium]|nr:ABC transporter permease [Terriglobales bacterium]